MGANTPVYDKKGLNEENNINNYYGKNAGNELVSYKITLAFTDNREITDDNKEILSNAFEIYQIEEEFFGKNIKNKTLSINNNQDIKIDENNLPFQIVNYSVNNASLSKSDLNNSILLPIEENIDYYIKNVGDINRGIIALLKYTPDEIYEMDNSLGIFARNGLVVYTNGVFDELTINSKNGFNYMLIYLYHKSNASDNINIEVQISKNTMPTIVKPSEIEYPKLNTKNLYFTDIPSILNRNIFYEEEEYSETQEMQGIATDGTYLYYCMHGVTDENTSCVGKINIETGEVVLKKNNTSYRHCNGITYNSKNNTLIISSLENFTSNYPDFYILSADTLEQTGTLNLRTELQGKFNKFELNGFGAISYVENLDIFVTLLRPSGNLWGIAIFDGEYTLLKTLVFQKPKYHQSRGGMWANDKYIYIVSTRTRTENVNTPVDVIQIFDYDGNLIEDKILNTTPRDYIEGIVVDYNKNLMYTSNATDKIIKYDILSYIDISRASIYDKFNLN